jgi:hypothetical protein
MQLYEKKVSPNGKVTYQEYAPKRIEMEIDDIQINTLVSSITVAWLQTMQIQLGAAKKGSALATRIRKVEEAIAGMAQLAAGKLDTRMVEAGTMAWGAAIRTVADELSKCEAL